MQINEMAFVFPGQGSQKVGMGKEFLDFAEGKQVFEEVDDALNFKLSKIIFEGTESELRETKNTQPALMAVSIACIRILEKEIGKPAYEMCSVMAGHSLGEYSALCASRTFSLSDTAILLRKRGEFMQSAYPSGGAMAAVIGLSENQIEEILKQFENKVVIANDNATGQIVISGRKEEVEIASKELKESGARMVVPLEVSGPFHSPFLESASIKMKTELEGISISMPKVPVISNVLVKPYESVEEIKKYLELQIIERVRWRETILKFESMKIKHVIELGSGKVLCGLFKRTAPAITSVNIEDKKTLSEFMSFFTNL